MSAIARYIVDAIVLEHRSPTQLACDHGLSRSWIYCPTPTFPRRRLRSVGATLAAAALLLAPGR